MSLKGCRTRQTIDAADAQIEEACEGPCTTVGVISAGAAYSAEMLEGPVSYNDSGLALQQGVHILERLWQGNQSLVLHLILHKWEGAKVPDAAAALCIATDLQLYGAEAALREHGADLEARDEFGDTAVICASRRDDRRQLKMLLSHGARADVRDLRGNMALNICAYEGNAECMRLLLASGNVDIENTFYDGYTALHTAVRGKHLECVRLLIEAGANVDARTDGERSSVHLACIYESPEILKLLVEAGATLGGRDCIGCTPLHLSITGNVIAQIRCIKLLVKGGVDLDETDNRGRTAVHKAAEFDRAEHLRVLLSSGARADALDRKGRTALHVAACEGNNKCSQILIDAGCSVDARDRDGRTPMHFAVLAHEEKCEQILVDAGASLDARDVNGQTPSRFAKMWYCQVNDEVYVRAPGLSDSDSD